MKRSVYIPILVFVFLAVAAGGFFILFGIQTELRHETLYEYDATALNVSTKRSSYEISFDDVIRMDREAFRLISRSGEGEADAVAIYERLVSAQYDFIALSYALTGEYRGSIAPITERVLCTALPEVCGDLRLTPNDRSAADDVFTAHLTREVFERIEDDWDYERLNRAWLDEGTFPIPDVPDRSVLVRDAATLNRTLETLTDEQKRAAIFWSGTIGTKGSAGIWLSVVDDYLSRMSAVPLHERAKTRAHALNAARTAFDHAIEGKELSTGVRPLDLDPTLIPLLPYDNTPGFPAASVAYIAAIAEVLAPEITGEDLEDFHEEVREAIDARLWAGAFLPFSVDAGERLGRAVGSYDAPLFAQ